MMNEVKINDHDEMMFAELRRYHLRHPGTLSKKVLRIMKAQYLSAKEIGEARLEWLRLGLNLARKADGQ